MNLEQKKQDLLNELSNTSTFSLSRSSEIYSEYDQLTEQQMQAIINNSGYDLDYQIGELQLIGLLKIAFAKGKEEQARFNLQKTK